MSITKAIYVGLTRKNSNQKEANRLGLSLEDYKFFKKKMLLQITLLNSTEIPLDSFFNSLDTSLLKNKEIESKVVETHQDLEKGTSKITGISTTEPKSPEEIIKLLGIDTTQWKLSQFWNKEQNNKWLVSALITRLPKEQIIQSSFLDFLKNYTLPTYNNIHTAYINNKSTEKVCGIISLQDLHFGKPGNENMGELMDSAITYLINKGHYNYIIEKLIFVIGPDTLNMDTFDGTTTKGTPVENSEVATKAYIKAFDAVCNAVIKLKLFCKELNVVFIPGNHDRLSSFHMLHAVAQVFKINKEILFDIDYAERKVYTYGNSMFALEHGDVSSKNNPLVYAVEYPIQWGSTLHRTLYTGHFHGRRTKEVMTENETQGFVSRMIPALTSSDYYHYHNKWTGNQRSAILHLHDSKKGLISEFIYSI